MQSHIQFGIGFVIKVFGNRNSEKLNQVDRSLYFRCMLWSATFSEDKEGFSLFLLNIVFSLFLNSLLVVYLFNSVLTTCTVKYIALHLLS